MAEDGMRKRGWTLRLLGPVPKREYWPRAFFCDSPIDTRIQINMKYLPQRTYLITASLVMTVDLVIRRISV